MLQKKAESGKIRIEIAEDGATGTPVAYCIATIAPDGSGEIESIVVTKRYRLKGIGSRLVQGALAWFGRENADPEIVMVAVGNENVSGFYEQYGFLPRRVMLQRKKE
jgi:GNAT superfamily N-acetyltransferase